MDFSDKDELFDKQYFSYGCGEPYERSDKWLNRFDHLAGKIAQGISPETVLDAGCALGFLVEKLRQREINAWGVDVSEYAISNVHPDIKSYCWNASITEPFRQQYDLIVCIEVLEHMPKDEAEHALKNLCAHADDILFSSTPFDFKEATHFNVKPIEYWAELFSQEGFYRDVDFDASFITPWAIRFRKRNEPVHRIVREYERVFSLLWQERVELRQNGIQNQQMISSLSQDLEKLREQIDRIKSNPPQQEKIERISYAYLDKGIEQLQSEIAAREQIIADKTSTIDELNKTINQSDIALSEQRRTLNTLQRQVKYLQTIVQQIERAEQKTNLSFLWHADKLGSKMRHYGRKMLHKMRYSGRRILSWPLKNLAVVKEKVIGKKIDDEPPLIPSIALEKTISVDENEVPVVEHEQTDPAPPVARGGDRLEDVIDNGEDPHAQTVHLDPYNLWLQRHIPSEQTLSSQRIDADEFEFRPLISIVTPVYNPEPRILSETIQSVLDQTYGNWELCLANGNPENEQIAAVILAYAEKDERIRIENLAENTGIAGNTNAAIQMAGGEFIQFLDHDDLLAPNALFEVIRALNQDRDMDIFYYDQDKLSEDSLVHDSPLFKPDWSPEMFLSANYLTHGIVRRSIVEQAGLLRDDLDGAQDWDFLLRCVELTSRIKHIPKILYHWRKVSGSTAVDMQAKPGVFNAQLQSVEMYMRRKGVENARAIMPVPGYIQVVWPLADHKVSIIIPAKDNFPELERCISSVVQRTLYADYEIIIVDMGSTQEDIQHYYRSLDGDTKIRVIDDVSSDNVYAAFNLGARNAAGDVFLFLCSHIEIIYPNWLEEMLRWTELDEIGIVSPMFVALGRQKVRQIGMVLGMDETAAPIFTGLNEKEDSLCGSTHWYRNFSAASTDCMMLSRKVFEEVNGFDETWQQAFGDIDLSLRVRETDRRILFTPFAQVLEHVSPQPMNLEADYARAVERLSSYIAQGDPYFNRNLSYTSSIPTLATEEEGDLNG